MQSLDILSSFDAEIPVPNLTTYMELLKVLEATDIFSTREAHNVLKDLESPTLSTQINVGIKRLLNILESARQDSDQAGRFRRATRKDRAGKPLLIRGIFHRSGKNKQVYHANHFINLF